MYHYAAKISNVEKLKEANERELNRRDEDGRTPTHWAAFKGNVMALIVIIGRGGNPKKCDHFGNSALHYAVRGGSLMCVKYLINFSPDIVFILDNNYKIAQDLALIHNHVNMYNTLENAYNSLLKSTEFDLKKVFRKTISEVKTRRQKLKKLTRKSFEKALAEYDFQTVNKKENESLLVNNDDEDDDDEAQVKQNFLKRLIAAPE